MALDRKRTIKNIKHANECNCPAGTAPYFVEDRGDDGKPVYTWDKYNELQSQWSCKRCGYIKLFPMDVASEMCRQVGRFYKERRAANKK